MTGPSQVIWLWFKNYLEKINTDSIGSNPDIYFKSFDTFGIADSRYLSQRGQQKSFSGQQKFFVLQVKFMTTEAQNALLKIFEEPPVNNIFFLIVRDQTIFLPTLCSRCQIISCSNNLNNDNPNNFAQEFITQGIAERLELITKLASKKEDFRNLSLELLDNLELIYYQKKSKPKILFEIIIARRLLLQAGSSPKIILEDIALALD